MQIDFSKKQLQTLLELVYLGNWMVNAHRTGAKGDPRIKEHEKLEEYIYEKIGESGVTEDLKYDPDTKRWYTTQKFEMDSVVAMYHNDYDDNNFWDELIDRLSWRDLRQELGDEKLSEMEFLDKMDLHGNYAEKYSDEFDENGLARLKIDESTKSKSIQKVERNSPCTCGSGKKYKKCCGK